MAKQHRNRTFQGYSLVYHSVKLNDIKDAGPYLGFFVCQGANFAHPSQGSPVYRQGSSWTFCFHPYTESCPTTFKEKNKH